MSPASIFDTETPLPDSDLTNRAKTLLGFDARYVKLRNQLRLLLNLGELEAWSKKFHGEVLPICNLVAEQYPLVIFYGDIGTGKTGNRRMRANRIVAEATAEGQFNPFQVEQQVRGSGKVGEMGTLISGSFA